MSYDKNLWNSIKNELKNDRTRQDEMNRKEIKCQNNQTLRFYDQKLEKQDLQDFAFLFVFMEGDKELPQ